MGNNHSHHPVYHNSCLQPTYELLKNSDKQILRDIQRRLETDYDNFLKRYANDPNPEQDGVFSNFNVNQTIRPSSTNHRLNITINTVTAKVRWVSIGNSNDGGDNDAGGNSITDEQAQITITVYYSDSCSNNAHHRSRVLFDNGGTYFTTGRMRGPSFPSVFWGNIKNNAL